MSVTFIFKRFLFLFSSFSVCSGGRGDSSERACKNTSMMPDVTMVLQLCDSSQDILINWII